MFAFEDRTRALLAAVRREGSIARAAQSVGMDASNARRHLATAAVRLGEPLVVARRGGRDGRNARLTGAARRLLDVGALRGLALEYAPHDGVTPVRFGRRTLFVASRIAPGPVVLHVPPESVTLARGRAALSSARNAVPMQVVSVSAVDEGTYRVALAAGALRFESLIVRGALRDLRIRRGSRLVATIKAVAVEVERGVT